MRRPFFAAIGVASLAVCSAAQATTVSPTQQKVFINHGGGYHSISGPVKGNPGDTVMAGPNGSAVITYDDGCKVTVEPGTVVTIGPTSPCQLGTADLDTFAVGAVIVGGAIGAAVLLSNDNGASP